MFDLGDIRYNSWEKPCSEVQFMRRKKKKNHQNVWSVHEKDFFFVEQVKHADCRGGYIVFIQRFNVPIGSNWHLQPGAQQGQLWGESCLYLQFMKKKWQAENLICIQEKSFFFFTPFFPFFCILVKHADCHFDVFHLFYTGTNVLTAISWNI